MDLIKRKNRKAGGFQISQITGLPQDLACPPSSLGAATAHHAPGSSVDRMSAHPMEADTSYIRPAPASKPQAASQKYGLSNDNSDLALFEKFLLALAT